MLKTVLEIMKQKQHMQIIIADGTLATPKYKINGIGSRIITVLAKRI